MRQQTHRSGASPRHIVLARPGSSLKECAEAMRRCGAEVLFAVPLVHGLVCSCPGPATLSAVMGHPEVSAVEPDIRLPLPRAWPDLFWPWSPRQRLPWGLTRVGAPRAWERSRGEGVRVAVIDTGADWEHPELFPNVKGGFNALDPEAPPTDDHGHGTHVAGTVAAVDNERGVVGVAPACHLYVVKAFDRQGLGATADVLLALQWCADHGMQVVKMTGGNGQQRGPGAPRARWWTKDFLPGHNPGAGATPPGDDAGGAEPGASPGLPPWPSLPGSPSAQGQ